MVGRHGGNEKVAKDAFERGEIKRFKNPKMRESGVEWLYCTFEVKGFLCRSGFRSWSPDLGNFDAKALGLLI